MNLAGKVSNQLGETQSGLTVELYEAATWEAGGIATASTTTNANGNWAFTAIDPTKTWTVVAISGSKRIVIDAQASIQLTQLEVITDISVDTINERTLHAGVTVDGVLLKDSQVTTDVINEKTLHAGVTIDGALLKDGFVVDAAIPTGIARDAEVDGKIDARITSGTAAGRPAAGVAGRYYYATDTGMFSYDNGTAWVDVAVKTGHNEVYGLVQADLAANRPAAGIDGRWFFATDTLILSRDNGIAWVEMARGETAIRLAQLSEKAHASLTGVTSDQHHPRSHDHSLAADGTSIAVAAVPNLDASKITSGRFGIPRISDAPLGHVLLGQGAGIDSAFSPGLITSVGNALIASADTPRSVVPWAWTKIKEIKLGTSGALRIRFDLRTAIATHAAEGQVRMHGVALGVVRSTTSGLFTTFTEDFTGLLRGHWMQLYIRGDATVAAEARNFRLYTETTIGGEVLLD